MRAAWLTDIHLNFLTDEAIRDFGKAVQAHAPEVVLLGGDVGDAPSVVGHLRSLPDLFGAPVYFVLGNHDFYHGSIPYVHEFVESLCGDSPDLHWLDREDAVELSPKTALVGASAWADARLGDYGRSSMMLNDYMLIWEFAGLDKAGRRRRMQGLADAHARRVAGLLPRAAAAYPNLIFLTHAPPFRDACWHRGRISDDSALPHFSCKAMGDVLLKVCLAHPKCRVTVLCGHTHSPGEARALPNLVVLTGGARYGRPQVQRMLEVV